MPAESKSQQRLFGMVRKYQEGEMKNAPKKIKEVAKHISPESAEHFAATKTSNLPEHVKQAGWYEDYRRNINNINGHYTPEQFEHMTGINVKKASHPDETEDKALVKKMVKTEALKKDAFDRGFMKAALENKVQPLLAIQLLKSANWMSNIGQATDLMTTNANRGNTVPGGIAGGLIGGGLGAYGGYRHGKRKGEGHEGRDALLGGLAGAGGGALVGGVGNLVLDTNRKYEDMKDQISRKINDAKDYAKRTGEIIKEYSNEPVTVEGNRQILSNLRSSVEPFQNIPNSSFLKSLMGQQPIDPMVMDALNMSKALRDIKQPTQ